MIEKLSKNVKHNDMKYTWFTAYTVNCYKLQMKNPENQSVKLKYDYYDYLISAQRVL